MLWLWVNVDSGKWVDHGSSHPKLVWPLDVRQSIEPTAYVGLTNFREDRPHHRNTATMRNDETVATPGATRFRSECWLASTSRAQGKLVAACILELSIHEGNLEAFNHYFCSRKRWEMRQNRHLDDSWCIDMYRHIWVFGIHTSRIYIVHLLLLATRMVYAVQTCDGTVFQALWEITIRQPHVSPAQARIWKHLAYASYSGKTNKKVMVCPVPSGGLLWAGSLLPFTKWREQVSNRWCWLVTDDDQRR